jgi:hypothetical protein
MSEFFIYARSLAGLRWRRNHSHDLSLSPTFERDNVRLVILILGREPEGIGLGHGAGGAKDFPEGPFEASPRGFKKPLTPKAMRRKTGAAAFSENTVSAPKDASGNTASPARLDQTMV